MQDAVSVREVIGTFCFWSDALCIVQDDSAEWEHEAINVRAI